MTNKHFEAIAAIFRSKLLESGRSEVYYNVVKEIIRVQANYFEDVNPDFDRERFLAACGIK